MPRLTCMLKDSEIENVKEDFRTARRVEQYRIGKAALYLPAGLRWNYVPLSAIRTAEDSFRVISGGHCVPVREKRPEMDLELSDGSTVHLQLEKEESMQKLLAGMGRMEL